ncbi:MAG: alpha/beta hydrolase family protein [Chloroflexales bacterium]|nr:alpha/beta hydrolase family protein [Chloroflexales bacterium]
MTAQRLQTPGMHRLIQSPLGAVFDTKLFERIKSQGLYMEFASARVGAAVLAAAGDVDAFLTHLGGDIRPSPQLADRIHQGLARYEALKQRHDALVQTTQHYLWEGAASPDGGLAELETQRRAVGEQLIRPAKMLGFVMRRMKQAGVSAVRFETPTPENLWQQWGDAVAHPARLYAAPAAPPAIEVSAAVAGPTGREYLIRFTSPAPFLGDTVYARVIEPEAASDALPTLIYGSGLGMPYDLIPYWPEENYLARPLAKYGCRTILIESPWHGRRTPRGYYTGEKYLATAPVGLFQLYAAQAQETAVLIQWAREIGASAVGVGGISLGGIVAQHVASRCQDWPSVMQPDMVFLGASSNMIDKVATSGEMAEILGLDRALAAAGWTSAQLGRLRPVLDPLPSLGMSPDRVYGVFGTEDTYVPFAYAQTMLSGWGVPESNIMTWDVGHMGVLLKLFRTFDAQELILRGLAQASAITHYEQPVC